MASASSAFCSTITIATPSGVDRADRLEQPLGRQRGQPGRRLVEQQQRRRHHERHRHGQRLPLTAGERAGGVASALGQQGKAREDRLDAGAAPARLQVAAHLEVLAHAERRKHVALLRHERHAERADLARRAAADRRPPQAHPAAAGGQHAGE